METYIQSRGHHETNVNGNVIDKSKWNVIYDGDTMNLEVKHNDEDIYMKLDNEDIMKLFELPSNDKTIDQRLENRLLNINNEDDLKPIIIEKVIVNGPMSKSRFKSRHDSKKLKSHSKSKHSSRKLKSHSKSKHSSRKSKSKSKSKSKHSSRKSKSKSNSKNTKILQHQITPDYLKTIY